MKHHKKDSKKPFMRLSNMSYEPKGFSYEVFNCETIFVLFEIVFATLTCNWFLGMKNWS